MGGAGGGGQDVSAETCVSPEFSSSCSGQEHTAFNNRRDKELTMKNCTKAKTASEMREFCNSYKLTREN